MTDDIRHWQVKGWVGSGRADETGAERAARLRALFASGAQEDRRPQAAPGGVRYIDVTAWSEEDVVKLHDILNAIREFVALVCKLFPQIVATNFETELYSVIEDHLDRSNEMAEARGRPMTKQDVAVFRRYFCNVVKTALMREDDADD